MENVVKKFAEACAEGKMGKILRLLRILSAIIVVVSYFDFKFYMRLLDNLLSEFSITVPIEFMKEHFICYLFIGQILFVVLSVIRAYLAKKRLLYALMQTTIDVIEIVNTFFYLYCSLGVLMWMDLVGLKSEVEAVFWPSLGYLLFVIFVFNLREFDSKESKIKRFENKTAFCDSNGKAIYVGSKIFVNKKRYEVYKNSNEIHLSSEDRKESFLLSDVCNDAGNTIYVEEK